MPSNDPRSRRARDRWDELLLTIPDPDAWAQAAIDGQQAVGLFHDGSAALRVARPEFISSSEWAHDQQAVAAVQQGLVAAGERVLADPELEQRYFGGWLASPLIAELCRIDPGYPGRIVLGRFDGVRTETGIRFLEFNGGLPGGAMPADVGPRYMTDWPIFASFAEEHPVAVPEVRRAVVSAWIDTWHSFGGAGLPRTVIAVPDELRQLVLPSLREFDEAIAAVGLPVQVLDPGALDYRNGRLRTEAGPVDLVVRAFFTSMFDTLGDRLDGLLSAVRAGDVCMIASIQSGIYGNKALFAALTDPELDLGLSAAQTGLLRSHLPWTRMVGDERTITPDGDSAALRDYTLAHRESLVIKPTAGFGGAGVELGWEHTPESWERAFDDARLAGAAIVQQRVAIGQEAYPMLAAGLPTQSLIVDHNPLVCSGTVPGYYIRASEGGITNVTGGHGSIVPAFRLLDRD